MDRVAEQHHKHAVVPASLPVAAAWAILATSALIFGPCAGVARLSGLRGGVVHVKGHTGLTVGIDATAIYSYPQRLTIRTPCGRVAARVLLPPKGRRTYAVQLKSGAGTYSIDLKFSHIISVSAAGAKGLVYEPEAGVAGIAVDSARPVTLYTQLHPSCTAAVWCATNQMLAWGRKAALTFGVAGADTPLGRLVLDHLDATVLAKRLGIPARHLSVKSDHLARIHVTGEHRHQKRYRTLAESLSVAVVPSDVHQITIASNGASGYVGTWFSRHRTLLAPAPGLWFSPEFDTCRATVRVGRQSGASPPAVGAMWSWRMSHTHARMASEFERMGLTATKVYINHSRSEPVNDNGSPDSLNWANVMLRQRTRRFLERLRDTDYVDKVIIAVTSPAPWLSSLDSSDHVMACREFAEFFAAAVVYCHDSLGMPVDRVYWQFHNEPNLVTSLDTYLDFLKAVGRALDASPSTSARRARLCAPGIGSPWGQKQIVDWTWIRRTLQEADRYVDAIVWNQYLLEDIDDVDMYRRAVDTTMALIRRHNSDGVLEPVLIGATNMRGGPYIEHARQDGMYAAVWWASVLVTCMQSRAELVTYFSLRDFGLMRKGMLYADGTPRPVAEATALVLGSIHGRLHQISSTHSGVGTIASSSADADTTAVVCVNTTRNPILLSSLSLPRTARKGAVTVKCLVNGAVQSQSAGAAGLNRRGSTLLGVVLPPFSVTTFSVCPTRASSDRASR